MENAQGASNHEDEMRRQYVNMVNEGTNSNGHGEGKEYSMNLVKTIKCLKKDAQSYKVYNERLMKSKEQQEGFNIKLMQILDIIEKNMGKETDSRRSGSHKSHYEGKNKKCWQESPSLSKEFN